MTLALLSLFCALQTFSPHLTDLQLDASAGHFQPTHSFTHVYDEAFYCSGAVAGWTDWGVGTEMRVGYMRLKAGKAPGVSGGERPEIEMDAAPVVQNWLLRLPVSKSAWVYGGAGVSWWFVRERLRWYDLALMTYEDASWRDNSFGWQYCFGLRWGSMQMRATWWAAWFEPRPLHSYHLQDDTFNLNGWTLSVGWVFGIPYID